MTESTETNGQVTLSRVLLTGLLAWFPVALMGVFIVEEDSPQLGIILALGYLLAIFLATGLLLSKVPGEMRKKLFPASLGLNLLVLVILVLAMGPGIRAAAGDAQVGDALVMLVVLMAFLLPVITFYLTVFLVARLRKEPLTGQMLRICLGASWVGYVLMNFLNAVRYVLGWV